MLEIIIPEQELFDDINQEFIFTKAQTLQLEHSLVSLSKWESKWCKPFLSKEEKTNEQVIDYIRCMTITQKVKADIYDNIPSKTFETIKEYIDAPMTATWFNESLMVLNKNKEIVTSEIIYYWMIAQNIPLECQKWHLSRLITLIRVCSIKNNPPKKKMGGRKEMLENRRTLNAARREKLNSKG